MELTLNDFVKMEEMDYSVFDFDNVTPAKEAYEWYLKDKNSCIVVKENQEVVGYINILSLKKEIFEAIKNNKMNESLIKSEDLDTINCFSYLYIPCIIIDKEFRSTKTLLKLFSKAKEKLNEIINKGYKIKEVMADCSTKEGEKMAQRFLNLKPYIKTSHNSVIHVLDGETFCNKFLKQGRGNGIF